MKFDNKRCGIGGNTQSIGKSLHGRTIQHCNGTTVETLADGTIYVNGVNVQTKKIATSYKVITVVLIITSLFAGGVIGFIIGSAGVLQ